MTYKVRRLLMKAYRHLGIKDSNELRQYVSRALDYLSREREYYIELVEENSDYIKSLHRGQIFNVVPLAQEVITDTVDGAAQSFSRILCLLVDGDFAEFACRYESYTSTPDNRGNSCLFPVYQLTELETACKGLTLLLPHQIRPVTNPKQWEYYGQIFTAYNSMLSHLALNLVPHNTERAFWTLEHTLDATLVIDGEKLVGRPVHLATGRTAKPIAKLNVKEDSQIEIFFMVTEKEAFFFAAIGADRLLSQKGLAAKCAEAVCYRIDPTTLQIPMYPVYH